MKVTNYSTLFRLMMVALVIVAVVIAFQNCGVGFRSNHTLLLTATEARKTSSGPTEFRGVRFNPWVVDTEGIYIGNTWLQRYSEPNIRAQVQNELQSISNNTQLTGLMVTLAANFHLTWPAPLPEELDRLVAFVDDVKASNLLVAFQIAHPCILPNEAVPEGHPRMHVGGHLKGEVVNGNTLYWDVKYCESNNIELAKGWFRQILSTLETRTIDYHTISYITHGGTSHIPFSAEMNLDSAYEFLGLEKNYLREVFPYLQNLTRIPFGIVVQPGTWRSTISEVYSFLDVINEIGIDQFDVVDITSFVNATGNYPTIDVPLILEKLGVANSKKVVLSDFRFVETTESPEYVSAWHLDAVTNFNLHGWWIWQYRDEGRFLGVRGAGSMELPATDWKSSLLATISGQNQIRILFNPCLENPAQTCDAAVVWHTEEIGSNYPKVIVKTGTSILKCGEANAGFDYVWVSDLPLGGDLLLLPATSCEATAEIGLPLAIARNKPLPYSGASKRGQIVPLELPCKIQSGAEFCDVTLAWRTRGLEGSQIQIWIDGSFWQCKPANQTGSQTSPVSIGQSVRKVELFEATDCNEGGRLELLDSTEIFGR